MYILLEGPEKVGKSSLARSLVERSRSLDVDAVHVSSRYHAKLNLRVYWDVLMLGKRRDLLVVADRAWVSEVVYSKLLGRRSPIYSAEHAERLFGAAMGAVGIGVILAPPRRRAPLDESDLQIPYNRESTAFIQYGLNWGYTVITQDWEVPTLTEQLLSLLAGGVPVTTSLTGELQ